MAISIDCGSLPQPHNVMHHHSSKLDRVKLVTIVGA